MSVKILLFLRHKSMKKNQKINKKSSRCFVSKKLAKLSLDIFKLSPHKKLNYKQLSKILKLSGKGEKLI